MTISPVTNTSAESLELVSTATAIEPKPVTDLRLLLNPEQKAIFKEPSVRKLLYSHKVFEQTIGNTSNIRSVWCLDTEYQSPESLQNSINKISDPDFKKTGDYLTCFNFMKEEIQKKFSVEMSELLKFPHYHRKLIEKSMGVSGKNFYFEEMIKVSKQDLKLKSPITISTQIKNAMSSSKGTIYLSPVIARYRQKVIEMWENDETQYPKPIEYKTTTNKGFVLLDELDSKGVCSSIERFDEKSDFQRESKDLKTHNITLVTFFGVVDILKSFTDPELMEDIKDLVRQEKLVHDKRLKEIGFKTKEGKHFTSNIKRHTSGTRLNWIITHNGLRYKVKLDIIDLTAMQGLTNLNELFINSGIENEYKKSLDNYKSCMFEALLFEPQLFHEYALGDLRLYDALNSYNENLKGIYNNLNIGEYFEEAKLTIGATVNQIIQSKIYQQMGISATDVGLMSDKEKKQFIADHSLLGSPEYLQKYNPSVEQNHHLFNGNTMSYNRILLGKTDGGRAHCAYPVITYHSREKTLCDIDLSGAYTAKMSNQDFYIGNPVSIIRPSENQLTLRQHIKKFNKALGVDNYYMRVSGKLKYEQDIIVSFMDMAQGLKWYKEEINLDGGEAEILNHIKHNLESTKNKILTMEVEDGAITPDILDLILHEISPRQRDDLLDNLKVKAFIYYPPEMELKNSTEYNKKLAEHKKGKHKGRYQKHLEWQDNEVLNPFHHYIKIPYGKFLVDVMRCYRAKYKMQRKESFNQMFKLIGNTIYGVNVSKYFAMSNVIFANNITAGVRCCIWYAEKALRFVQTITDGGIGDLNNVPHPIYKSFDSVSFVRAYLSNNRDLNSNNKWELKPISRSKEPITFNEEKQQWLLDGKYYDEEGFKKIVPELLLEHIQKCFPKNRLMNAPTKHLLTDNIDLDSENITPEYEIRKGGFTFDIKDFIISAVFTGQTNYSYTNWRGEVKTKNRSYETKKNADGTVIKPHTAFFLNKEGNLYLDEEFYKYDSPSEMVFKALLKNPQKVPLLPPFVLPIIIKTKDWLQSYEKTYKYSCLNFGDTSYKIAIKSLFELSLFKFKTKEQYYSWLKVHDKLKNKYNLTFELFFLNEDGTCNVEKMNKTIDYMIVNNVINPLKGLPEEGIRGLDINRHLSRRISNTVKVYLNSIKQAKRYHRLSLVGYHKYLYEFYNDHDYLEKIIFESEFDYYDTNKYSNATEFTHHDLEVL